MSESLRISASTSARNSPALAPLRVPPGVRDDARRQSRVAVDARSPSSLQRVAAPARSTFADGLVGVGAEPRGGAAAHSSDSVPRRAAATMRAELALEPQHVLAQALAFEPARRELLQHLVDEPTTASARTRAPAAASTSTSGKS